MRAQYAALATATALAALLSDCNCGGNAGGGNCADNKDCGVGMVCSGGRCEQLCNAERDCPNGEVCRGGICVPGNPCDCTNPPASACIDTSTYRAFSQIGDCALGTCDYGHVDFPCADCPNQCATLCNGFDCSDNQQGCRLAGWCVPESPPRCDYVTKSNGSSCTRTNGQSGTCESGVCAECTLDPDCDDSNACTVDTCNSGTCEHAAGGGDCTPQATETQQIACGTCGSQSQQRTCNAACTWGGWVDVGACNSTPICTPNSTEPRSLACGNCGQQQQQRDCQADCTWGAFYDVGGCAGSGPCSYPSSDTTSVTCGNCGQQQEQRDCQPDCTWGGYYNVGGCNNSGICSYPSSDTLSVACGNCGQQQMQRDCQTDCAWTAFYNVGTCTGQGACAPGSRRAGSCDTCSEQVCGSNCQWGGCQLKAGNQCNWQGGSTWRCCVPHGWQFCLSTCRWSTACSDCTPQGCGCP